MDERAILVDLLDCHLQLKSPVSGQLATQSAHVKGPYEFYHYRCDGFDDIGWGCGYRTLQTLCSWLLRNQAAERRRPDHVPSIVDIQRILHECGDKPSAEFVGSRDWIGCFEASIVIDHLFDVPCKILHYPAGKLGECYADLLSHFDKYAAPVMMGGDLDNSSKGILGISRFQNSAAYLLNANPHLVLDAQKPRPASSSCTLTTLVDQGWLRWDSVRDLNATNSFYNFCLPCCKFGE